MMILVYGGSVSGKSVFAEEITEKLASEKGNLEKYYLATMQVWDEEGKKKIERHRKLRSGKGFITIEQPVNIAKAGSEVQEGISKCALLECMSNLVANEMFSCEPPKTAAMVEEKVLEEISQLKNQFKQLVVVSNNVFEDGILYDDTTMEYGRALGRINEGIATMADEVYEVVVGIPLLIKGDGRCS